MLRNLICPRFPQIGLTVRNAHLAASSARVQQLLVFQARHQHADPPEPRTDQKPKYDPQKLYGPEWGITAEEIRERTKELEVKISKSDSMEKE